jgi:uncharacterized protein (TIGR02099 family)
MPFTATDPTPLLQSSLRLAALAMRWIVRIVVAMLLLLLLGWAVLHWVILPRVDEFRPRLVEWASGTLGAPVSIGRLHAESNGLVPSVSLHDVQVHDPTGRAGLRVRRVLASFSVLSLAGGGLEQLVIDQPELEMRRTAQGRLLLGGIDLSGDELGDTRAADWFFSQTEFLVREGRVTWIDDKRQAAPVGLHEVQLVVRNGRRRHQIRLDATPEASWGERFTVIGQFRQPVFSRHPGYWREWDGQAYAEFRRVDVSQLRQYIDLKADWGVDLLDGHGALRLWAGVRKGLPVEATADLAVGRVEARFGPDLAPLAFASVTGRLAWRDQGSGSEFDTRDLHFVDADGLVWPGGNFTLNYRDGQGGGPVGGELRGDQLDLAALAKIASRLPLPPKLHEQLKAHPVQGLVERISARWDGPLDAPRDWQVGARLSRLAIGALAAPARADGTPVEGVPGLSGATLDLQAGRAGGRANLSLREGALEFPGVFEEPRIPLAELDLRANWQLQGEHITVNLDELKLSNADLAGSFKARWHTTEPKLPGQARFPGVLDLQGSFSHGNGARVHRYLPLVIPAEARHYVRDAIQKGEVRDVAVRVKGDLHELPFDKHPAAGEFRIAGQVQGVTMAYVPRSLLPAGQPPWPALEALAGELVFERNGMRVNNARARVQGHPGWQFPRIQASLPDFEHSRLKVEAEGRGALSAALGIVRQSALAGFTEHALDQASASGDAGLQLKLDLPIEHIERSKVEGRVALQGNDLRITPDTPPLGQAQGAISFTDTGFAIQDVRVRLLGGEARVSGGHPGGASGDKRPDVVLRASGTASAEALRQMSDWGPVAALARQASGRASYEAVLGFGAGATEVLVTSDLRGLAVDLPAPLGKPADAAWPLRYESRPQGSAATPRERLRVSVAELLALEFELDTASTPARPLRGAIGLGVPAVSLPASGVSAQLRLPRLDVDAWEGLAERLTGAHGGEGSTKGSAALPGWRDYLPNAWSLRVGELHVDERSLHDVSSTGTREGTAWHAEVQARELAGRIDYGEGADGRAGKLRARLARLAIPASAGEEHTQGATLNDPPAHMPALDVVVEQFELRGKKLGRLEVEAVNLDAAPTRQGARGVQEWQLSRLALRTPEASFSASGQWAALPRAPALPPDPRAPRAPNDPRRTQLDFRLDVRDGGALLARLDMPGVLTRGSGRLEGSLGWAGSPLSPHYPSMTGQLRLDFGAGQFLKASPGMAKLLGVISLQALPRRLTLDFRDLFSSGFAFDSVRGDVAVQRGVARTNNLQMKGVNAAVLMEGSADIDKETQDLRVLVVPEIDAGTAALAATVINPVIGISAFLAQLVLRQPLIKAATREFHIGGSWDNPQVTRIDGRAGGAAPPRAPASSPNAKEENPP